LKYSLWPSDSATNVLIRRKIKIVETIWKFQLKVEGEQIVEMPQGAQILCIQVQNGVPCIWAKVFDWVEIKKQRIFETIGTGQEIPPRKQRREYIGTYQLMGGALVYHVYEIKPF
jgi:hypothetical protein